MEKLYYNDTYLKETQCTVLSIHRTDKALEVITDKTVFYPECGGQPGDRGMLGTYEVLDTRKADNGDSVLILKSDCPVKEGNLFLLSLDWEHRYKYMVMHTAQHLLSGLLFSKFNIGTVAVHLGEDYLTIEVSQPSVSDDIIKTLIEQANREIAQAHRIIYHEMSHEDAEKLGLRRSIKVDGDVRIVEIEDVDRIACGGVHVNSTSELNLIVYTHSEQIRGNVRLYFKTGSDALSFIFKNQATVAQIKNSFSCNDDEILTKIDSLKTQLSELKKQVSILSENAAESEIKSHLKNDTALFKTDLEVSSFASCIEKYENLALCVFNGNHWLIGLKGKFESVNFNEIRKNLFPLIDAKGGGRNPLFQGICNGNESAIKSFMDALYNTLA